MYIPPYFEQSNPEELERIISNHPLGTLVYQGPEGLDATHIPFINKKNLGANGGLVAHVARKNPIWQQVADGTEVLTIFHGSDAYISPNWYPSKHETHRLVPTWNYEVVHVKGTIRFIQDSKWLRSMVAALTNIHETNAKEAKPWKMSDGEKDYIAKMIDSIVGVEITISKITGAFKLSQNREPGDRIAAAQTLHQKGMHDIAESMLKAKAASSE